VILAPLRGVTIRCFRETFSAELVAAGCTEAITPFITATSGFDPLKDRELRPPKSVAPFKVTPQFIGKDPAALRACLERIRAAGYDTADLNAGCPFPMVRNKGRGSGLLRTPDVLRSMLEVGCEVMGEGRFSVKTRLGVERADELLEVMPLINAFPLRFLTVHARTAKQMYAGACDRAAFERIAAAARVPVLYNGDADLDAPNAMVGRAFIRHLGRREDSRELASRYLEASVRELAGDHAVLGRMKEFFAYWKELPLWRGLWGTIKMARTVDELRRIVVKY